MSEEVTGGGGGIDPKKEPKKLEEHLAELDKKAIKPTK